METVLSGLSLPVDWILLAAAVVWVILRGSRGFYDCLMPLLITLAALLGALILTWAFRERAAEYAYPWVRDRLLERMDLSAIRTVRVPDITAQLEKLLPATLMNIIAKLGLELRSFVEEAFHLTPAAGSAQIAGDAVSAVLLPVTRAVVRVLLFFGSFLMLKLIFSGAARLTGLAFKLPMIGWVNRLGGMVLGFLEWAVAVYLLCWVLSIFFPETFETLREQSRILAAFFPKGAV